MPTFFSEVARFSRVPDMEAVSKFEMRDYERVEEALKSIRDPEAFLNAGQAFSTGGPIVRFGWPDWPEDLSHQLTAKVAALHERSKLLLKPVAPDTERWNSVIQGWRSDPESAKAVAEAFSDALPGRVRWVFSRCDRRGRIAATCSIQALGDISVELAWNGCFAAPLDSPSAADRIALSTAVDDLTQWAGRRIRPILDALRDELKVLYGGRFRGLYVFGSYARPDAGIALPESSDLDVALILSDFESPYEEIARYGDIVADLSLEHNLVISVKAIREADYKEKSTNFTRVISEYAIRVG